MPSWNWGESQSESGVVHQSTANTDHNDAATLKQGCDYANFSEITPDPVTCYPLHEDSGTTAYDVAGTTSGAYTGVTLGQSGLLGTTAPDFDGTNDYVDIGESMGFSSSADWTYSIWFYSRDASGSAGSNPHRLGTHRYNIDFLPNLDRYDSPAFQYWDGSENVIAPINTGEWYHGAIVADQGNNEVRGYLNGNQEATISGTPGSTSKTQNVIGARGDGYGSFDGYITDVRMYSQALTTAQIQTLYDVVATQGTWTGSPKTL